MEHVQTDDLGLLDVSRHDRIVPELVVPVHSFSADDLNLRDKDDPAASGSARSRRLSESRIEDRG